MDNKSNDEIVQIDCSDEHTALLTKKGKLFTCGNYIFGKLGYENYDNLPQKGFK